MGNITVDLGLLYHSISPWAARGPRPRREGLCRMLNSRFLQADEPQNEPARPLLPTSSPPPPLAPSGPACWRADGKGIHPNDRDGTGNTGRQGRENFPAEGGGWKGRLAQVFAIFVVPSPG
ncbi:hypothetical protein OOU_Y34scaffold00121g1 [Pyricularia oryzae Y34]|uniref:Uncharacterized protein n=1 Tax=Pyricularia oryzae (strain Y34) TaxID=1143189 RepID=A0AA97PR59_PYRO3|nr:hypothetical protein OOU_Y34scaffold00121g1 [Pyricularia oryzae Y34]